MSVFDDLFERIAKMKKVLAGKPDFEWAIVKNVSPIMIRLDNTGVDIPISSTLIGGLIVNDRVMVMIQRGRVTIIGRGNNEPVRILSGSVLTSGAANTTREVSVAFPVGFFDAEPIVTATARTSNPQNAAVSTTGITKDGFNAYLHYTTATDIWVNWIAVLN